VERPREPCPWRLVQRLFLIRGKEKAIQKMASRGLEERRGFVSMRNKEEVMN